MAYKSQHVTAEPPVVHLLPSMKGYTVRFQPTGDHNTVGGHPIEGSPIGGDPTDDFSTRGHYYGSLFYNRTF